MIYLGKNGYWNSAKSQMLTEYSVFSRWLKARGVGVGPRSSYPEGAMRVVFPAVGPPLFNGAIFYVLGGIVALVIAAFERRRAIITKSPYEAVMVLLLRSLVPRSRRPKVVIEIHADWRAASREYGSPRRRFLSPLADALARYALVRADLVRVVADHLEALVRDWGYRGPVQHFLPFTDYPLFFGSPRRPAPRRCSVLYVATLEPYKGPDVLLRAWAIVVDKLPEAKLTVVGTGSLADEVIAFATANGLMDSVRFVGQVDRAQVCRLLDESDCLALPSHGEGLSRAVLEAFARGRPIIATDIPGNSHVIEHGRNGLLVPTDDVDALAGALIDVLTDRGLADKLAAGGRSIFSGVRPEDLYEDDVRWVAEWLAQ